MRISVVFFLIFVTGCASSLSTLQSADTLEPGSIQLLAGVEAPIPRSQMNKLTDTAKDIESDIKSSLTNDPKFIPSEEQQRTLLDAAVGIGFNGVMVPNPVMVLRVGIVDNVDAGLYYSGIAVKGDVKYRFFKGESISGALSLGVSKNLIKGSIFSLLEKVKVDEFSRLDIHVPLIFGGNWGNLGRYWFGVKYVFSKAKIDAKITNVDESLTIDNNFHYVGGMIGGSIGYKYIFVFAEVTAMNLFAKPTILGEETDIGGLVLMPALGLSAEF
jgi:hypothetical protein